ncbi:Bro-N domain-containing protein [Serratia marcescens]|uniref:BRO-N domain-containing protein n=1 Tax=Serratia marcescens TaxID=615 RepID=UPI00345C52FC
MSTNILTNTFEGLAVRCVMIDGQPYFIAKDVAMALGYKRPDQAIATHCEDAMNLPPKTGGSLGGLDSRLKVIPESDVYALIFGSKLESAQRFRKWVTKEVLPSIRKSGGFISGVSDNKAINSGLRDRIVAEFTRKGKDLLSDIDRLDRYGNMKPEQRVTLADALSRRHGLPASLVEEVIDHGLKAGEAL